MNQQDMIEQTASALAELGHKNRLMVFRLLVRAGRDGLSVGEIQSYLDIPNSTLSHHLQHMMKADLLTQTREGRVLRCTLNFDHVDKVLGFLMEDCCKGLGQSECA
ncbi:metalloregulator ArsR/SmtB family transcription factor [Terasakiella sp. A23]|uniref:ArsR/SmtB family transcription factor n=1 Tax=Terasakiella sp. FCG-A23 TaxID=3080561 RepID=UPI0029553338|nr:metalloregulator ArsR/SmtB family transcription factor [Terasakiella sp. A23]MDV7340631.1 metalloregulator ArsR/SmtB family transcription factor [Terasakiella sp. A23]